MIDFYILNIAHVLLFTLQCCCVVWPCLVGMAYIYIDQCATCLALENIIFNHTF